jgi:hypothetical protein
LTFSPGFIKNEIKQSLGNEIHMIDEENEELINEKTASVSTNRYKTGGFSEPSI